MDKVLTRDELDAIKQKDQEQYKMQIAKDWETQNEDIAKVKAIMASYEQTDENATLIVGDKPFPKWALDAYEYFTAKYGMQYGSVIYEKVLSKIWGEVNFPNQPQTI